jgi:hypothetical protein
MYRGLLNAVMRGRETRKPSVAVPFATHLMAVSFSRFMNMITTIPTRGR